MKNGIENGNGIEGEFIRRINQVVLVVSVEEKRTVDMTVDDELIGIERVWITKTCNLGGGCIHSVSSSRSL